jgi:hypothetical protein
MNLYQERDIEELGEYYSRHMVAMTKEGLHSKSAIAAELAHRDREIESLLVENERLKLKFVELTEKIVAAEKREEAQKRQAHSNYSDYRDAMAEIARLKAELTAMKGA